VLSGGWETFCVEARGCDVYNGAITGQVAATLGAASGISNASGPKILEARGGGNGLGVGSETDPAPTLTSNDRHAVAYRKSRRAKSVDDFETWVDDGVANTVNTFDVGDIRSTTSVVEGVTQSDARQVRRLTPIECERLQGFPDDYTKIPWRKKPADDCPDGPRYKAMGNSMAVPVMRWIAERVELVEKILNEK
jgi:DNA (cytosine-5)-methyltransferase 1